MESNFKVPQMETIKKTAEIFGLPVHFVRAKVNSGEVVAVRAGRKFLVNVDRFAEYLNSATIQPEQRSQTARLEPIKMR
ncbi:MAG: helix-turn-helix domain-containing protein [Oscillospiraceae bacterium]|nr:helix-turn-helix domain-containing protein [Oscillospiraceae bacterium]